MFQLTYILPVSSFGVIMIDVFVKNGVRDLLDLNVIIAWVSLILVTPMYILAYMYLDAIIPNAFGIKEHPFFCIRKKIKKN
jgi:hypothetical protein